MSSEPLPLNYWTPGWEGVLADGTRVKTVITSKIPKVVWDLRRREYDPPSIFMNDVVPSIYGVGVYDRVKGWIKHDLLPPTWNQSGSGREGSNNITAVVPIEYLEPDPDPEWGELTP